MHQRGRTVDDAGDDWSEKWIRSVADGSLSMSQRRFSSVERHGGLARLTRVARSAGVHLAIVTDDRGDELIVASLHPFRVLC
jgi:hypothetical protein